MIATGALTLIFGKHQTSDFWGDCLRMWWVQVRAKCRGVRRLVVYLDNGPKNSGVRTQFLKRMIEFSDKITPPICDLADENFSVIRCLSDDNETQSFFLETMAIVLSRMPESASEVEVANTVNHLCYLFLAMSRPASRTVQGLWAELFVIHQSMDKLAMMQGWRIDDTDVHDFNFGTSRLEVKSTSARRRSHYFSYEQVHPPVGTEAFVASVFVQRVANGLALGTIWDDIRGQLASTPDLQLKLDQVCMQSLGEDWNEARTATFDSELANESLAYFDVKEIPRLERSQPIGVSEIRFKSDLENSVPLTAAPSCQ